MRLREVVAAWWQRTEDDDLNFLLSSPVQTPLGGTRGQNQHGTNNTQIMFFTIDHHHANGPSSPYPHMALEILHSAALEASKTHV